MSGSRPLRGGLGFDVAFTLATLSALAALVAFVAPAGERAERALTQALIVGVPVAAGLYAVRFPRTLRFGVILIGAGLLWSLTALAESSASLPYSVGRVAAWLIVPLLIYLMLAFPDGRLAAGFDRTVFGGVIAVIAVLYVGSALFAESYPASTPWAGCRTDCPPNAFLVLDSEPAVMAGFIQPVRELISVALLGAVTVSLWAKMSSATRLQRRSTAPLLVMSIASLAILAAFIVTRRVAPDAELLDPLGRLWALCVPGIAAAFFVGLLRRRLLAVQVLERLSSTLIRQPDARELRGALAVALDDPTVEVLFAGDRPGRWQDAEGRSTSAPETGRAVTVIRDDGAPLAALVHDPALRDDDDLLDAVRALVLAALRQRRLTSRLSRALEQLDESRRRIVSAADGERERIQRDLHDGAQQRLIVLRIKASLAEELLRTDPAAAAGAVAELGKDVELAVDELRRLSHGVYPALLSDRGLADALRGAVLESRLPAHLQATGVTRHPREIEAALYFTCLEAIQNAGKHAGGATGVWISLHQDGALAFEVRDDGAGFTPPAEATAGGLRNMCDRIEAVGGELGVESAPGHGTRIRGSVPLRAGRHPRRRGR